MNLKKILIIGSANTDMVIKTKKFPLPGETVLGTDFLMNPGGKGANQAVAAARLGANVSLIARVGNDVFGKQALQSYKTEGINTEYVFSDTEHPSGIALITVDTKGENNIVVAPGANGYLSVENLKESEKLFQECEIVLIQLEIAMETVIEAVKMASHYGKKVILNPAPAAILPDDLLPHIYLITPNRSEIQALTNSHYLTTDGIREAANTLREKGVKNVVVTLGIQGAYILNDEFDKLLPRVIVEAVDTTAAGDVFNGAIAVALSENLPLDKAVEFANEAAAISVTRMGAQASAPYRREIASSPVAL